MFSLAAAAALFPGFIFVRGLFDVCLRRKMFLVLRQGQLSGVLFGPRQFGLDLILVRPTTLRVAIRPHKNKIKAKLPRPK